MAELDEEQWCDEQRERIADYLAAQPGPFGELGEWPAWHAPPHVAIWAVESFRRPGWVGWWVIGGDLPTDYCTALEPVHPRTALKSFLDSWSSGLEAMQPGDAKIGDTGLPASLAPMLSDRIETLRAWAADDELWPE